MEPIIQPAGPDTRLSGCLSRDRRFTVHARQQVHRKANAFDAALLRPREGVLRRGQEPRVASPPNCPLQPFAELPSPCYAHASSKDGECSVKLLSFPTIHSVTDIDVPIIGINGSAPELEPGSANGKGRVAHTVLVLQQAEVANNTHFTDALQRIYRRDIVASESMLEQSLSNLGDTSRLRHVVRKLVAGTPIISLPIYQGPDKRRKHSKNTHVKNIRSVAKYCSH